MFIALAAYLAIGLLVTMIAGLAIHSDRCDSDVKATRNMVKWAWGWPILLPFYLISGWVKLIPIEYFRKLKKD